MRDYTDISPAIDDIRTKLDELMYFTKETYHNAFGSSGNIYIDATLNSMESAIEKLETAQAMLKIVEDEFEEWIKK